ncbi:hypothetical protein DO97_12210 [Neosynechococcus sphagnicola sy1]|uniref:Uncharacterized protein n=1 Tax=Neosynechococcus sphagnicola sy1 TaxID=1497020 RepID=A0A098TJ63_9CYAN|nr:hypothetical protein DO97_12210 [Neosynechococcus sphagnicola sy1]
MEKVKAIVERALADDKLTRQESNEIMDAMLEDGEVSDEERELFMSIKQRIWLGEILIEE